MKKNSKNDQHFEGYSLAVHLAYQCYDRDCKGEDSCDGRYNGTIRQQTLASVLAEETTIVDEHSK